jgi:hypothetical protein
MCQSEFKTKNLRKYLEVFLREKESMKDAGRWDAGIRRVSADKAPNIKIITSKSPAQ